MRRLAVFASILISFSALPATAQTNDGTTLLLQRIAAQNGGTAQVFVGKLPDGIPKVPLPDATLVGSVHQSVSSPIALDSYDLYYTAPDGALASYGAALTAAGWTHQELPTNNGGFVASTGPQSGIYCKANEPLVTAQVGTDPQDLRVSITPAGAGGVGDLICGKNPLMSLVKAFGTTELPQLHVPAGVRMSVPQIGLPNAQSAAYIHNGTSAAALLDNFAAQMIKAGWKAGARSNGDAIVAQTFRKADAKTASWQCVISIEAVDGKPGEFVAFIEAANIETLSKGAIAL
ncbi:MAG TPA: hypothetical protein VMA98_00365 [Candidatus Acidoferrales bacterium]|nr:hypothetical protein [Candidatus Acidoferrales bacterium]